jgi:hypothetical protein
MADTSPPMPGGKQKSSPRAPLPSRTESRATVAASRGVWGAVAAPWSIGDSSRHVAS